jgi:hypothetical protein
MSISEIPSSVYVAVGAFVAALIAGMFSYLNMIATKENKVSEFRCEWIKELRNEISTFTAAIQNLTFITEHYVVKKNASENHLSWLTALAKEKEDAIKSITNITLMLNHQALLDPTSLESCLMKSVNLAREEFNKENYNKIINISDSIRFSAGPLLKSNWETVKLGENGYKRIKRGVAVGLCILFALIILVPLSLLLENYSASVNQQNKIEVEKKIMNELIYNFAEYSKKQSEAGNSNTKDGNK